MRRCGILEKIGEMGVVPVIGTGSADEAVRVVEAVHRSGIRVVEITISVPGALQALERVVREFEGKVIFGAGTVLDPEIARACMLAGAEYIVSPCLNPRIVELAKNH